MAGEKAHPTLQGPGFLKWNLNDQSRNGFAINS